LIALMGLRYSNFVNAPAPGKAIEASGRNGLVIALGVGLAAALGSGLLSYWMSSTLSGQRSISPLSALSSWGPRPNMIFGLNPAVGVRLSAVLLLGLSFGLSLGLNVGLRQGGGAYLRHHLLRWLLVR